MVVMWAEILLGTCERQSLLLATSLMLMRPSCAIVWVGKTSVSLALDVQIFGR